MRLFLYICFSLLIFACQNQTKTNFDEMDRQRLEDFRVYMLKELSIGLDTIAVQTFFVFDATQCAPCQKEAYDFFLSLNTQNQTFIISYRQTKKPLEIDELKSKGVLIIEELKGKLSNYATGAQVAPLIIVVKKGKAIYSSFYSNENRKNIVNRINQLNFYE